MCQLIHWYADLRVDGATLDRLVTEGKAYRCTNIECYGTENFHLKPGFGLKDVEMATKASEIT